MPQKIHLNTARVMLNSGDPVSICLWTKKGEIQRYDNCISLRYDFSTGTRNVKLLDSHQIRKVRDVCLFMINDLEIFL